MEWHLYHTLPIPRDQGTSWTGAEVCNSQRTKGTSAVVCSSVHERTTQKSQWLSLSAQDPWEIITVKIPAWMERALWFPTPYGKRWSLPQGCDLWQAASVPVHGPVYSQHCVDTGFKKSSLNWDGKAMVEDMIWNSQSFLKERRESLI